MQWYKLGKKVTFILQMQNVKVELINELLKYFNVEEQYRKIRTEKIPKECFKPEMLCHILDNSLDYLCTIFQLVAS